MKVQPYRLINLCREMGILTDALHERLQSSMRAYDGKSLIDIMKSDVSTSAFKELAQVSRDTLLEIANQDINPFRSRKDKKTGANRTDGLQPVNLQDDEMLYILRLNQTPAETFLGVLIELKPALKDELKAALKKFKNEDQDDLYCDLFERRRLDANIISAAARNSEHPYYDDNRMNQIRRIFSLNEIVEEALFDEILQEAIDAHQYFCEALFQRGKITEGKFVELLSEPLELPTLSLKPEMVSDDASALFPTGCVRRETFLPLEYRPEYLHIAVADPLNFSLADTLSLLTCRPVRMSGAPQNKIIDCINQVYSVREASLRANTAAKEKAEIASGKMSAGQGFHAAADADEESAVDSMTTVQLVSKIIEDAMRANATDIHMEPTQEALRVRYRIDGVLHKISDLPRSIMAEIISRVKVMANMDVTERRRPQDGNFSLQGERSKYDFRVSTLPCMLGEKIVIRALRNQTVVAGLTDLGLEQNQQDALRKLLQRTYGCILTVGPTGSGKTTTLYTALNLINNENRNLVTIEDPVEYQLPGVNQVPVNFRANVSFASGLRSILRQDPDVIMVGEIRDPETAQVAMRAALTGHLVFSTLHSNTGPSAISSLGHMGVPHFLISTSVAGIISQRLVRLICQECKTPQRVTKTMLAELGLPPESKPKFYEGKGCDACWGTGKHGRVGIYEVMVINAKLRNLISDNAPESAILEAAVADGMMTLRENAILKIKAGLTTAEEIISSVLMNE
ncbi:type II/IV secretion system protein [Candidatus Sumerlaeota bacterium]|nr:type II/IV secretion system protein [Candidatus Sumerlaeota bacterium]